MLSYANSTFLLYVPVADESLVCDWLVGEGAHQFRQFQLKILFGGCGGRGQDLGNGGV